MKQFSFALAMLVAVAIASWHLSGARTESDARLAHQKADAILWPLFVGTTNEWVLNHGAVSDPGHLDKLNAGDKKRFDAMCDSYRDWHDAMKQAGY